MGSVESVETPTDLINNIVDSDQRITALRNKLRNSGTPDSFREVQHGKLSRQRQRRNELLIELLKVQADNNLVGKDRLIKVSILSYPGEVYHRQSLNRTRFDLKLGENSAGYHIVWTTLGALVMTGLVQDSLELIELFGEYRQSWKESTEEYVQRSFSEVKRVTKQLQELESKEYDPAILKQSPVWIEGNGMKVSLALRLLEIRRQAFLGEVSLRQQIRLVRLTTPDSERDLIEIWEQPSQGLRGVFRIFDPRRYDDEEISSKLAVLIEGSGGIDSERPRNPNPIT